MGGNANTSKGGQADSHPRPSSSSSKKNIKPKINRPLHTQMTRLLCIRGMWYWMWRAGATRTPSSPRFLLLSCFLLSNGACVVCRPTERSLAYCYRNMIPQPSAFKKLLHSNKTASFKNYPYYGVPAVENNGSVHGGIAILMKNTTPHQQLHINTGLQAIALRATCHKTITICSIYLSPSIAYSITELDNLIGQLPPPVLLLKDFNAHSQQWGSNKRSSRGKMVEDFRLKSNLSLLNSASPTYLHPVTASFSAIDLGPLFRFLLAN